MSSLLALPIDISLTIISLLPPEDILSLKQTCRVLHSMGCCDYVWHQMALDLPLDLPLKKDIKALKSNEIQSIVMNALRLERNWLGNPGRPRQFRRIQGNAVVHQMQPLGSEWLVTLTRSPMAFQLCIRSLKDNLCYRIVDCHVAAMSFTAALQSEASGSILTIEYDGIHTEHLNVYSFSLPSKQGGSCTTRRSHTIPRPTSEGTFSDIQICGNVAAASIACFMDMINPPSYELLFINIVTNVRWYFSAIPSHIERLRFKLVLDRVILVGVRCGTDNVLAISVHSLPLSLLDSSNKAHRSRLVLGEDVHSEFLHHYEMVVPLHGFDFCVSSEALKDSVRDDILPVLIFPHFIHQKGTGCILRLPLDPSSKHIQSLSLSSLFKTPARTSVDVVCLGGTGRRAVWLRRQWETDSFELMRGSFSRDGTTRVRALFPKDMTLPFEIKNCVSLAFDEATGRVYVGLHTGGLYVLNF